MTERTTADLLAERRATIREMRATGDLMAKAMLMEAVNAIDRELDPQEVLDADVLADATPADFANLAMACLEHAGLGRDELDYAQMALRHAFGVRFDVTENGDYECNALDPPERDWDHERDKQRDDEWERKQGWQS